MRTPERFNGLFRLRRRRILLALAAVIMLCGLGVTGLGCGDLIQKSLGLEHGYLFYGRDVLTNPGRTVELRVRLQGGSLLRDKEGRTIQYWRGEELYKTATTNDEGFATVTFTPEETGNIVFTVKAPLEKIGDLPPEPARLMVCCRDKDEPVVIVDIDKTLVASGFKEVLIGTPEPMPHSQTIMKQFAEEKTIVYLTHRPIMLGPKSKNWLLKNDYPPGPVLLSRLKTMVDGNQDYKTQRIRELKTHFNKLQWGFGDKISDAKAYIDNGLEAVIILHLEEEPFTEADDTREFIEKLNQLPDSVHVVTSWPQIQDILDGSDAHSRSAMQQQLREHAEQLEKRESKSWFR